MIVPSLPDMVSAAADAVALATAEEVAGIIVSPSVPVGRIMSLRFPVVDTGAQPIYLCINGRDLDALEAEMDAGPVAAICGVPVLDDAQAAIATAAWRQI